MLGDIYKAAIRYGMRKRDYFHSTPSDIDVFITQKAEQEKNAIDRQNDLLDYQAWLNGLYVSRAVAAVLNGRKSPYPKVPLSQKDKNHIVATEDMSQEEKDKATQLLFGNLEEMQKQFEMSQRIAGAS